MNFRRLLVILLCLPALLASNGLSLMFCTCGNLRCAAAAESLAAPVEQRSCCESGAPTPADSAKLRAPCKHCCDLSTPSSQSTRVQNGSVDELANSVCLRVAVNSIVAATSDLRVACNASARVARGRPPGARVPLRI